MVGVAGLRGQLGPVPASAGTGQPHEYMRSMCCASVERRPTSPVPAGDQSDGSLSRWWWEKLWRVTDERATRAAHKCQICGDALV
nr:hypothetical protein GCM10010200_031330 [Actinomadura rugatobispora]